MTLKDILQDQPTLTQLDILQQADVLLPAGRYYAGPLAPALAEMLTPKEKAPHQR